MAFAWCFAPACPLGRSPAQNFLRNPFCNGRLSFPAEPYFPKTPPVIVLFRCQVKHSTDGARENDSRFAHYFPGYQSRHPEAFPMSSPLPGFIPRFEYDFCWTFFSRCQNPGPAPAYIGWAFPLIPRRFFFSEVSL